MLTDMLDSVSHYTTEFSQMRQSVLARSRRYAQVQERLISPEGAPPAVGRSITYRMGALQLLGQIALRRDLPSDFAPAQVRCGMTAVIRRLMEAPGTFDANGFLTLGFCGHQASLAEDYISTGSLYLCCVGLLPLGLPASDEFWTGHSMPWNSQLIYGGQQVLADHAIAE